MRKMLTIPRFLLPSAAFLLCTGFLYAQNTGKNILNGAWQVKSAAGEQVLVFEDGYFIQTDYSKALKEFNYSRGGRFILSGNILTVDLEFHTAEKEEVGKSIVAGIAFKKDKLIIDWGGQGGKQTLTRIDKGENPLAGYWRINGRWDNDKMNPIPLRSRKTIKILSGTRFQWVAINTETKEFFGTGGGTYTFKEGKYTEHIEFFSRDSSRVGAQLVFEGKVEKDTWLHSGLSSKGDPIKETWVRNE